MSDLLGLVELLLVVGVVLGYAVWEVVSLKRAKRRQVGLKPDAKSEPPGTV